MRKKIALRWRREALRRGVIITSEKMVFSKKETREHGYARRDNAYAIEATFNGLKFSVADDDMLSAYKLLIWCIETTGQDVEQGVLAGFVVTDSKGFATWFAEGAVSKTVVGKPTVGSNPTPSAILTYERK